MDKMPALSFIENAGLFLLFISLSFGLTVAVSALADKKDAEQRASAALSQMLEQHTSSTAE